jgi:hypothetical protein
MVTCAIAVLGTVLSNGYHDKLDVEGLPDDAAEAVGRVVFEAQHLPL